MMALLAYCITRRFFDGGSAITGVRDGKVFFVECGDLFAAVSHTPPQDGAPPVSDLLAYGRVVEVLYLKAAVIPLRYGWFLTGTPELERLLADNARQYESLLEELDGHVEMGIRVLLPESIRNTPTERPPVTGRQYLAVRRASYAQSEGMSRQHKSLVERYNDAFSGLYRKYQTEAIERAGRVVVSLYYLVPTSAVGSFREAFAQAEGAEGVKTLVSGPWPPYSFVNLVPSDRIGRLRAQ